MEYLTSLAEYNLWANTKIVQWCGAITDEQWNAEVTSSFNSIKETVAHNIGAERIWLERFEHKASPEWYPNVYSGNKAEVLSDYIDSSQALINFVISCNEDKLKENITYKRLNGQEFSNPLRQLLVHVFNHSTYHRGQMVTILRQIGFTEITSIDYLNFINLK